MSGNAEKKTMGQKCSSGCSSFGQFLYGQNEKGETTVMGRTGNSWAKIGLFYLIFYGFLAGFFSAMLSIFLTTINKPGEGAPKLVQYIKNQPGLLRIDSGDNELDLPFVFNNDTLSKTNKDYTKTVSEYLSGFDTMDNSGSFCDKANVDGIPKGEEPCKYDYMTELGACADNKTSYGLTEKKPCFFLRINKIYGWVPENDGSPYLKLTCDKGTVMPAGFMLAAFPFRGTKGHQLPVVAVQVDLNSAKANDKLDVTCKLEGKNIKVSGSVVPSRAFGKIRIDNVGYKN